MIFVIEDDEIMAECISRATGTDTKIFRDGIMAMKAIAEWEIPSLIFLDILLNGPDGFTFLNELVSYLDTARIPIVIVSTLELQTTDLKEYGVVGVLNKDTMVPEEIRAYAERYSQ